MTLTGTHLLTERGVIRMSKQKRFRYDDLYKRRIHGDECCPFWRVYKGGSCVGFPGKKYCSCKANADGSGCPLFPKHNEGGE